MYSDKVLEVKNRTEWRRWLNKNHVTENEIWLIYYKKSSGKKRIPYNDAVEEALCFGWIDSTIHPVNDEKFAQRFTPRRKGSKLSEMNKERIKRLIKNKKMTPAGYAAVAHLINNEFIIPKRIINALQKDEQVWHNFKKFPDHYKRIRIAYIEGSRRQGVEEYKKRLNHFIKMTALNKKFGMIQ